MVATYNFSIDFPTRNLQELYKPPLAPLIIDKVALDGLDPVPWRRCYAGGLMVQFNHCFCATRDTIVTLVLSFDREDSEGLRGYSGHTTQSGSEHLLQAPCLDLQMVSTLGGICD